MGEFVLLPHRAAAAGIKRVAAGLGVETAERGARLERNAGHAADMGLHRHDMARRGEGGFGRRDIAESRVDQHIVRQFVPQPRRVGLRAACDVSATQGSTS